MHVLVPASRKVHEQDRLLRELRRALDRLGDGMARLQRRDDALEPAECVEGRDGLVVIDDRVFGAPDFVGAPVGANAGTVPLAV